MVYEVYKKIKGHLYAYQIKSIWDKEKKKVAKQTIYLGKVIDEKRGVYQEKKRVEKERLILDFGDTYVLDQFFRATPLYALLKACAGEEYKTLFSLMFYRLCYTGAMMYAQRWYDGNIVKIIYPQAKISSQRISNFLMFLGDEILQRRFFEEYLKGFDKTKQGIIIDGTSLPNQIHIPMTAWGLSGEEIDKQIRFLLVVDKKTTKPLFFRTLPGNIVDVSTVKNTIKELAAYGITECFIYSDAGFFSEENIKEYYSANINFLTRLPATRTLYKQLIKEEAPALEKFHNGVRYGKRALFVKEKMIDLFGRKAYAYIIQDPKRKGREIERYILENLDEKGKNPEQEYEFLNNGIMILVSSFQFSKEDVVPAYYVRQTAEMLFGFSKDDIGILPLRVHNDQRLSGFLFLQFLTLILFIELKNKLGKKHTVEELTITLRNLKCKMFDTTIIISELTKEQRIITEKLSVMVPKSLGI